MLAYLKSDFHIIPCIQIHSHIYIFIYTYLQIQNIIPVHSTGEKQAIFINKIQTFISPEVPHLKCHPYKQNNNVHHYPLMYPILK